MTSLIKYILWEFKPASFVRSVSLYRTCHTFRSRRGEADGEDSDSDFYQKSNTYRRNFNSRRGEIDEDSDSDFYRRSNTYRRNFNSNRQYGDFKPRQWYDQPNFRRRDSFNSSFNERIPHNIDRKPLSSEKYFYVEHPDIVKRSEDEVENFRKMMNISVSGVNVPRPITKFSELCLPANLMKHLNEENFSEPSAIQSQGWPIALSGRDMIGVSQTGSGKTLAFMLPAIVHAVNQEKVADGQRMPRILVLGPTRELVQQIHHVSNKYLTACGLFGTTVYGGASKGYQLSSLRGADVCIATPGRLIDFLSINQISLENCSFVVLDEADRMLDMGFEPQIRNIMNYIRPGRQTLMWSATWPNEIRDLAKEFLTDYIHVTIGSGELVANPNIKQNIIVTSEEKKENEFFELLERLFSDAGSKILVFAQTKKQVDYLTHILSKNRCQALGIHGDISQSRRDQILNNFRRSKSCVLIATDVAARGLDITDIKHVINYDFPSNVEDYIHRIGRTARGVGCGESHSFFTAENAGLVRKLVALLKQSNQEINPELYSISEQNQKPSRSLYKFYSRQRMYRNL